MTGQELARSGAVLRASQGMFPDGPKDLYERLVANEWDPDRALRAYLPLYRDEQIRFDLTIIQTFQRRIRVARRLIDLGLVEVVDNPFRVSEIEYETADEPGGGVHRSMSPIPRMEFEKPEQKVVRVPVYFTGAMFQLDLRSLETSRNKGVPLDTTIAVRKTRSIVIDVEDAIINGPGVQISGNASHGLLDAPSKQTLSVALSWDDPSNTGLEMVQNVIDAISLAESQQQFGPFDLVLNTEWFNATRIDLKAFSGKTVLQRLREIEAGGDNLFVYVADRVPDNTAILYPRAIENVRIIVGNVGGGRAPEQDQHPENQITPISLFPWDTFGGFIKNWLVTTVIIPDMRQTQTGQSGIVVITSQGS
jgi:uncharacterized linocin/CFP29 family protein